MKNTFLISSFFMLLSLSTFAQSNEMLKFAKVQKSNHWGIMNEFGKLVVPCIYEEVWIGHDDLILIKDKGKYGFINNEGKVIIPAQYEDANMFSEGVASVSIRKKYGFIDHKGKKIIDFQYEMTGDFSEGLVSVRLDGHWGFIDHAGRVKIPLIYNKAYSFYSSSAVVKLDGKYGVIDKQGQLLIPIDKHYLSPISRDLFKDERVVFNSETNREDIYAGLINKKNKIIVPLEYIGFQIKKEAFWSMIPGINFDEEIYSFEYTNKDYRYGLVSKRGENLACCYYKVGYVARGLYSFLKPDPGIRNEWILIDSTGKQVLDSTYEKIEDYSEGLISVKKNGLWGFVNLKNEVIINFQYSSVSAFEQGVALALGGANLRLIDKKGNTLVDDLPFEKGITLSSPIFNPGFIVLEKENKFGAIDYKGKLLFQPVYDNDIDFRIEKNYRIQYPFEI